MAAHAEAFAGTNQQSVLLSQHARLAAQSLHPLYIALLSYHMGAPINAANTACAHRWKPPAASLSPNPSDLSNFRIEGDSGDVMEDHRITFVWEANAGGYTLGTLSGSHNIFPPGGSTPRELTVIQASGQEKGRPQAPLAVLYDAKSVACYYTSPQDLDVVRNSITLDFQAVNFTDTLLCTALSEEEAECLNLPDLLTSFPILDYEQHFHRLLFREDSLAAMGAELDGFALPSGPHAVPPSADSAVRERVLAWQMDNDAHSARAGLSYFSEI